ncbi:MAG: hypothetical protein K2M73_04420 [Lachnospiraceae bacterium]|nr:hypothetical protein [Lachnospiraceae bacterium]
MDEISSAGAIDLSAIVSSDSINIEDFTVTNELLVSKSNTGAIGSDYRKWIDLMTCRLLFWHRNCLHGVVTVIFMIQGIMLLMYRQNCLQNSLCITPSCLQLGVPSV